MQHLPWKFRVRSSIDFISQNWVTEVMQVNPDLVCPPSQQTTKDKGGIIYLLHRLINCMRGPPACDDCHLLPVNGVTADRRNDIAILLPELPLAEGQIIFANLPMGKLSA